MSARLQPGDVVAGRYVIERVIGEGGMGVVAAAQHLALRHRVALKFLRSDGDRSSVGEARLLREAQALAQLRGEHVARVLDAGTLETGEPFLAMELLEGSDLGEILRERGALPVVEAVSFVLQACEGIAEAHALGIVHRDVKPANLFVTRTPDGSPRLKVLDFGLSKLVQGPVGPLTDSRHMIGSPHFMSPEQMRSAGDVDARTDIWSLGVVLHTCLTGRVPNDGLHFVELCTAILTRDFPSVAAAREGLPEGLDAVVQRCLRRDVECRYGSAADLAFALLPFGGPDAEARVDRIARIVPRTTSEGAGTPARSGAPSRRPEEASAQGVEVGSSSWGRGVRPRAVVLVAAAGVATAAVIAVPLRLATRAPALGSAAGPSPDGAPVRPSAAPLPREAPVPTAAPVAVAPPPSSAPLPSASAAPRARRPVAPRPPSAPSPAPSSTGPRPGFDEDEVIKRLPH